MSIELSNAADFLKWMDTKARLNSNAVSAQRRCVYRGQVYWCHFGFNIGSEISKATPRPAIIVQNYQANRSSSNTIVVPVTHNKSTLPCMVPLVPVTDENGRVLLDGKADVAHIICVSKARLGDLIAKLPPSEMKKIDRAVAESLELLRYYNDEQDKYNRLMRYVDKVKEDRNTAQNQLDEIRKFVEGHGFDEFSQAKIREILDI